MSAAVDQEFQKLFSFLCETEEERQILTNLAKRVEKVEQTAEGGLNISIKSVDSEEAEIIECEPAFAGKAEAWLPKSYVEIAKHFNSIIWESIGGGAIGFGGLDETGKLACDWNWEPEYLEETMEDEAEREIYMKAVAAFGCAQNWLLFDPIKKNQRGEAALVCWEHDCCEWNIVESADQLSYGGVLLRLMAQYFLDYDFDGVYF